MTALGMTIAVPSARDQEIVLTVDGRDLVMVSRDALSDLQAQWMAGKARLISTGFTVVESDEIATMTRTAVIRKTNP